MMIGSRPGSGLEPSPNLTCHSPSPLGPALDSRSHFRCTALTSEIYAEPIARLDPYLLSLGENSFKSLLDLDLDLELA